LFTATPRAMLARGFTRLLAWRLALRLIFFARGAVEQVGEPSAAGTQRGRGERGRLGCPPGGGKTGGLAAQGRTRRHKLTALRRLVARRGFASQRMLGTR